MRRSGDLSEEGDDRACPVQVLIPTAKFSLSATSTCYDGDIMDALEHDRLSQEILQALRDGTKLHKTIPLGECQYENGLLLVNKLVYVPDSPDLYLGILKNCHDHPTVRHSRRAVTYKLEPSLDAMPHMAF